MKDLIPCSVQVLVRNSVSSLRTCLPTVQEFAEVIVQDGNSTDGSREFASSFANVTLMNQDLALLDSEGRITDFSAMRNQSIRAAKYDWIFVVDADEEVMPSMVAEVREIVTKNIPGVFRAFRRFYVDGEPVMHCAGYPAYQIRLFHRSQVDGYVKPIHERLALHPGVELQLLATELTVPFPSVSVLQKKNDRYLRMEVQRVGVLPFRQWCKWILLRNTKTIVGLGVKTLWITLLPRKGKKMPMRYDLQYMWHSFRTIVATFPPRVAMAKRRTESQTAST